jgi:hypothetical protein
LEFNIPVPKLKISDSISFCADAWEAVTNRTIYNCWKKTGILPSFAASPFDNDNENSDNDDDENGDDDEIDEVQKLLDQYNNFTSGELISAKEFILIDDDDNYGEEEITDEEIIKIVKPNEEEIEDDLISQPKISTSEVLESLDKVLIFLNNPPDGFTTEFNNRSILYNLKKQIILFDKDNRVQSVLTNWLEI